MRTRPTEPQLMLVIILFVVFAFLMQGRAHGEGGLGNGIRPEEKYQVEEVDSSMVGKYYRIHGVEIPAIWRSLDKEPLEDLAFALNRAHEERTRPVQPKRDCSNIMDCVTLTPNVKTISVDTGTFYDCKDGVKATPCTAK